VLSHLGSQAEIFGLFVDAGVSGGEPPSQEAFQPIWDAWNARSPQEQAADSTQANEALVSRLEGLDAAALDAFRLQMFGMTLDASALMRMRLSEHALHSWDVAVAFDPGAEVPADAVELLVDGVGQTAARSGRAPEEPLDAFVTTTGPGRTFRLRTDDAVHLEPTDADPQPGRSIVLPAELFLRVVYGRANRDEPRRGPLEEDGLTLDDLVRIFPGF
jgi:uncharacterized protein (TIGR03083 family)